MQAEDDGKQPEQTTDNPVQYQEVAGGAESNANPVQAKDDGKQPEETPDNPEHYQEAAGGADTNANPVEQVKGGSETTRTVDSDQQESTPKTVAEPDGTSAVDAGTPNNEKHSYSEEEHISEKAITLTAGLLLSLLNGNEEGKSLIEKAKICELSDSNQHVLAGTIARFHLNHRRKLLTEDLESYWLAIKSLFKFERKVSNSNGN